MGEGGGSDERGLRLTIPSGLFPQGPLQGCKTKEGDCLTITRTTVIRLHCRPTLRQICKTAELTTTAASIFGPNRDVGLSRFPVRHYPDP